MTQQRKRMRIFVGAALASLAFNHSSLAEDGIAAPIQQGYVEVALAEVSALWQTAHQVIGAWASGGIPTTIITSNFAERETPSELDFKNLMDLAGYSGLDVRATVGLVPRVSTTFHQSRQMAETDRTRLLRLLRKHQRAYSGPIAMAERLIIYSILEINSSQSVELKNVVVTALPLPSAEFIAGPKSKTGLGPEAAKLSEQIESLRLLIKSP